MEEYFEIMSSNRSKRTPYLPSIESDEDIYVTCPRCGSRIFNANNRKLKFIVEGKGKLTDILMCGEYPLTIVSENVINAFEKEGITGFDYFEVGLLDSKKNPIDTELKFYNMIATSVEDLDFKKMKVRVKVKCSECNYVKYNKETYDFGAPYMKERKTKDDIFVFKYFEDAFLCNKKVLQCVNKYKLTNFAFTKFEDKFNFFGAEEVNIKKYLKENP